MADYNKLFQNIDSMKQEIQEENIKQNTEEKNNDEAREKINADNKNEAALGEIYRVNEKGLNKTQNKTEDTTFEGNIANDALNRNPISDNGFIPKKKTKNTKNLILIILAILLVGTIAYSGFFINSLNNKIDLLTEQNQDLSKKNSSLNKKNKTLKKQSAKKSRYLNYFNTITNKMANNSPSSNYFSNDNFIVLSAGESKTVSVICKYPDEVWYYEDYTNGATAQWNNNWNGDTTTWTVTGDKIGVYFFQFTVDNHSDKFTICVVVTD